MAVLPEWNFEGITTSYITLQTPMPQPRITNQEWIISENKETLNKYNNPEIKYLYIPASLRDTIEDYPPYGLTIVTLQGNIHHPYAAPREFQETIKYIESSISTKEFKIKVPGSRSTFLYSGDIRKIDIPAYIIPNPNQIQRITLTEVIKNGENVTTRFPVALQYANIIWVLWDLSERTPANKSIMRHILQKALDNIPEAAYPRQKSKNYERDLFIKTLSQFNNQKNQRILEELTNQERSAQAAYKTYTSSSRQIQSLKIEIAINNKSKEELDNQANKAADYFDTHKNVEHWEPSVDGITFILKELSVEYLKERIQLPKIKVNINLNNGEFKATPADKKCNLTQVHPHIFNDGRACAGNFTTIFPKLVANNHIQQVLELLIQFFESYNTDSPAIKWSHYRYCLKNNLATRTFEEKDETIRKAEREWADYLETIKEKQPK